MSNNFNLSQAVNTPFSFRNKIINGNFDIWHRGNRVAGGVCDAFNSGYLHRPRRGTVMTTFILPAILCWLAMLAACPLVPIAVASTTHDGRLPRWAWWLETHDNLGWAGPLSEGYPASKWGLCRWLWRNKAYTLRDQFRARPTDKDLEFLFVEEVNGSKLFSKHIKIGKWWQLRYGVKFSHFKLWIDIGWKLQPYVDGHRPTTPTATGILIPLSLRSDDYDD